MQLGRRPVSFHGYTSKMNKPKSQEVRQQLLDAAKALMTRKGYTAVGLAEIVASAGVPKGSFYYYFKSKEDFGLVLLEDYFSKYLVTVSEQLSGEGSGLARLQGYFQYWASQQCTGLTDGKCLVVKLGPEVCDLSEDMRLALKHGTDRIIERIGHCVALGQDDGSIGAAAPPRALAESLYQLWLGATLLDKLNKNGHAFEAAMVRMDALLR